MAIFSPLPGSRACLDRGPRQVPGSAVVAADRVSVDAGYDSGVVALYGASRYGGCGEAAARRLAAFAKPAMRQSKPDQTA
jgi:hypothetical protein